MLQDELAIAQLQPGLEGGGKECMPSFYASICDKNIGQETRATTAGIGRDAERRRLAFPRGAWEREPNQDRF